MSRASTIAGLTAALAAATAPREGIEAFMFQMAEAQAKSKGGATLRVFEVHQKAEAALSAHGAAVAAILLAVVNGETPTEAQVQALIDGDEALDLIEVEHKAAHEALKAEQTADGPESLETSENEARDPLKLH